jgi:hypothetical protein
MEGKPKRILSPEALEKIQLARKKALEAKQRTKEITIYQKEQERLDKQKKRDDAYTYSLFTQPPHEGQPSRSARAASASAPPFQSGGGDWSRIYMGCREPGPGIVA